MRLPASNVTVLGTRYRVKKAHIADFGECHFSDGLIVLNADQSADSARDTLLHEIIHAIDYADSLQMTEEQVRRVATGLRAVFTANPRVAKFLAA